MEIVWKNVPLIAWLSLGNAALWVACINRLHALNLPEKLLRHLRHVHDLMLVGFPAAAILLAGTLAGPWFDSENWHRLPLPLLTYAAVCNVASIGVIVVLALRLFRKPPSQQISSRSRHYDIAQQLGFRPVGHSRYQFLTYVPRNELLHLEVTEKEFALPRLPPEWAGLRVLHLSDFHFIGCPDLKYYERLIELTLDLRPDLVVFTGDLLDRQELQVWLAPTLGRLSNAGSAPPLGCYFILGNHDAHFSDPQQTRRRLEDLGWHNVAGRSLMVTYKGLDLAICGSETPWMGHDPELADVPADAFRLLLSHTPDNIGWAQSQNIDLMLSGHNHGGQVRLPGFGPVFSPSVHGGHYAAGTFWESPTLLHVSRGVGAQHPLRLNCPPEVSLLVLHPAEQAATIRATGSRELLLRDSA